MEKVPFVMPEVSEEITIADSLISFYKGLGWDSDKQRLNPSGVIISENNYKKIAKTYKEHADSDTDVSAFLICYMPRVEESMDDNYVLIKDNAFSAIAE